MKTTTFLFLLVFGVSCLGFSQSLGKSPIMPKNVLKAFPIGFINKAKFGYEYAPNQNMTVGFNMALYYMLFKGVTLGPTLRLYFTGTAPHGLFFQLQAHYFSTSTNISLTYDLGSGTRVTRNFTRSASGVGGGFGLGYQFLMGANGNVSLDLMAGLKYLPVPEGAFYVKDTDTFGNTIGEIDYTPFWYLTGPGSIINCHISVGYAF
ncbi:MAG: hypothetical protein SNJ77_04020 [Cytophagales bacterium]